MTATGIPALLEPIQNRLNAATPGPWEVIDFHEGFRRMEPLYGVVNIDPRKPVMAADKQLTVQVEEGEREDAEFIAAAPMDQARLLAAVQAVVAEIEDTDLETNEAQQGDLADRILSAVAAALGGEA
ncbi:hypothetical protein FQP90_13705 [Paenarthrobacter nitroguajacolicus]|uniref:Uncharacterized protein n=1 Tax=Paenarthrobacter nitroguajacolicus TaxID=211146 RepID=A0A558GXH9_PAENT|nr:hypothetical protein [Paenarthrobacter nitroguajacolicus]TVU61591.1 hypothetical protein FQP90_13705 [Paenarthrobacter nitroguajacolicus]